MNFITPCARVIMSKMVGRGNVLGGVVRIRYIIEVLFFVEMNVICGQKNSLKELIGDRTPKRNSVGKSCA